MKERQRKQRKEKQLYFFLIFYLFLERWGKRGRSQPATQVCALTRNQTSDFSVCRPVLNPTEPHQQGGGPQNKTKNPPQLSLIWNITVFSALAEGQCTLPWLPGPQRLLLRTFLRTDLGPGWCHLWSLHGAPQCSLFSVLNDFCGLHLF